MSTRSSSTQSTWENATASCRCAVEDADVQLISRRIVRWGGSSTSEESLYLHMVSPRAARTLLGTTLKWHVDDHGRTLGWRFPSRFKARQTANEYLDRMLPSIYMRASSAPPERKRPPSIFLVPPDIPGALRDLPARSSVIVVFDSDSSTDTRKSFSKELRP